MSDGVSTTELSEAVQAAVSDVLAKHGCMLEGFVGMVNYLDNEGGRCWMQMYPTQQSEDHTYGMSDFLHTYLHEVRVINVQDAIRRGHGDSEDE